MYQPEEVNMRLLFAVVVIVTGYLFPLPVDAQTIRLKNGNSLEGEVQIVDGEQVAVDIPGAGRLIFPAGEVASIEKPSDEETHQTQPAASQSLPLPVKRELLRGDKVFKQELVEARREVDARKIKKLFFHISENLGAIEGYVRFLDNRGTEHSTRGVITISKEVTEMEKGRDDYWPVPVVKERTVKTFDFGPDDFQAMTLKNKDEIFALPILHLDPDDIKQGDTVILEWRSFKEREKVL